MRIPQRASTAVFAALLAISLIPATPAATAGAEAQAQAGTAIKVGSYNIRSVQFDSQVAGEEKVWRERRPGIVSDILSNGIEVLGVQEAYNNPKYASQVDVGPNQYTDLLAALNAAGGSYALVDDNPDTTRQTRIVYDTRVLTPVSNGFYQYQLQPASELDYRHLVWAVFSINATGQQFFFTTTHLINETRSGQRAQWTEMIGQIKQLSAGLPVVATGDFQKSKKDQPAISMIPKMRKAGFGDVVGQKPNVYDYDKLRAKRTVNGWINSTNHFQRKVSNYSNRRDLIANNIDYIFASNNLEVLEWKVCANLTANKKKLSGVIRSDHFLVRAIIRI